MAGRALRGMLSTADYKGYRALKSCHTEFVHIYGAAFISIQRDYPNRIVSFCVLWRFLEKETPLSSLFFEKKFLYLYVFLFL